MTLKEIIPVGASIIAFIIAAVLAAWVSKQKPGTQQMLDISNAVGIGAMAFLRREFKIVIPIAIGLASLDWCCNWIYQRYCFLQLVLDFLQLQD